MDARFADIEFGLVWDEAQDNLDISLRFTKGAVDPVAHPKEPLTIDLDLLDRLVNNELEYGVALLPLPQQLGLAVHSECSGP